MVMIQDSNIQTAHEKPLRITGDAQNCQVYMVLVPCKVHKEIQKVIKCWVLQKIDGGLIWLCGDSHSKYLNFYLCNVNVKPHYKGCTCRLIGFWDEVASFE